MLLDCFKVKIVIVVLERSKKAEEDDMFILPEAKINHQYLASSDDEAEEQWLKRSATREAVYGSAMMVRSLLCSMN